MTHTVKMLKTVNGYDDLRGNRELKTYEKGGIYDVSDDLLETLINDGAVELVEKKPLAEDRDTKVVEAAETKPMTKAEKKATAKAAKE